MSSLLEIKRDGEKWEYLIFPTASLPLDDLENDVSIKIIELICQEMSSYMPGDLFMPHEVADVVRGAFDIDDFNSFDWVNVKESIYEIVLDFSNILFQVIKDHSNFRLLYLNDEVIKIAFQTSPMENF